MNVGPETIEAAGKWIRDIGVVAVIALFGTGILGYAMLGMFRQQFQQVPMLKAKIQELTEAIVRLSVAIDGLHSDVQESLRELRAFQMGQQWPRYDRRRPPGDEAPYEGHD